jgi:hypothetical protein
MKSPTTKIRSIAGCSALALLALSPMLSYAGPIFPSRGVVPRPLWMPRDSSRGGAISLDRAGFFGGVTRGFGSTGERFAWQIDISALAELWRWGEDASLMAIASQELQSDIYNDIAFNPRGIFWEEGLLFTKRATGFDWQTGFLYRCRHDVDNADPLLRSGYSEQRTLIYMSLPFRVMFDPMDIVGRNNFEPWVKADIYLIRQDYRIPKRFDGIGNDFRNLAFGVSTGGNIELARFDKSNFYTRGEASLSLYGANDGFMSRFSTLRSSTLDGRIELGYRSFGRAAAVQYFVSYESLEDDASVPTPANSKFFSVGFRLSGVELSR